MNILFLLGVYPSYGGVEKVTTILANAFVEIGHNVSIVSFEQPHPELAKEELSDKTHLYKLEYPVRQDKNVRDLKQILIAENINVIINQWAVPWFVTKLCKDASKGLNVRLFTVHHNQPDTNARIKAIEIDIDNRAGNSLINHIKLLATKTVSRLSLRYVFERSDKFIILSPNFVPVLKHYIGNGIKDEKIISLANPLTIAESNSQEYDKRKEILVVGRIEYNQKRTFRIVDIWEILSHRFPDWHLVIVGDGPDREDLEKRFLNSDAKNYSFEGFQNPTKYYEMASIQLLVSEYEGFGLVLVEGMSRGCIPVVLDSYAAAQDVIPDDKVGLRLPYPFNKDTFVEKMTSLMSDPDRLIEMQDSAIAYAQNFSLQSIIEKWENLLNNMYGSI